ncbi:MAG: sugar/nucleoside kinase (ribokinase family) [Gammaproteobacteria bacterium]|jgi:sugar/nucleoside kinase (ribokinase family)
MKKYHVYGIGAALVDTEIQVSDRDLQSMSVEKGLMTLVDETRQEELNQHLQGHAVYAKLASGGSACNSIFAATCFGANSFYSCKVANDTNGQFFLNDLREAGVQCVEQDHNDDGVTGKCLVLISPDAERSMNTHLGISETLSTHQLDKQAIIDSEFLYIEGYLVTSQSGRAAAVEAKKIAQENGVKTSISLSDPGMVEFFKEGLNEMIGDGVNLLFCNEDEAKGWAKTDDINNAIAQLKKISKTFAITLGARGAIVYDGQQLINIEANSVAAIDTNGAGDMFAGAFLYAITNGLSYAQAGKLASLASATIVTQYGPRLLVGKHADILETALGA